MIKKCRQIWICNRRRYLTWKKLLAKAATIKRFENSPLGTEIKKKKMTLEKQYQRLDKVHGFNKTIMNKKRKKR